MADAGDLVLGTEAQPTSKSAEHVGADNAATKISSRKMAASARENAPSESTALEKAAAEDATDQNATSKKPGTDAGDLEAAVPDLKPLLDLLEKSPGEAAEWTLQQMRQLGEAETLVESTPIFKVASALKAAPVEQKNALISTLMRGAGDLTLEERKEILRLFTDLSPEATKQIRSLAPEVANEFQTLASSSAAKDLQDLAVSGDAASLLSANFARVAKEAADSEMTPQEFQSLMEAIEKERQDLVQPFLDVVPELTEEERKRLSETLVEKGLVSEENRTVLENTLKPGGHADQFANYVWWFKLAYQNAWLVWALPTFEIFVAVFIGVLECKLPALPWIIVDALLAFGIAVSAWFVRYSIRSVYKDFCDEPLETLKRLRSAHAAGQLDDAIPGAKRAGYVFGLCIVFVVLGAIWGIVGFVFIAQTVATSCPAGQRVITAIICLVIAFIRIGMVVATVVYARRGWQKYQQLRGQVSEPLLSEPEPSYGAVGDQ